MAPGAALVAVVSAKHPWAGKLTQSQRRGGSTPLTVYMIEGDSVTWAQMAERLGLTADCARKRFRALQKNGTPVTWKALAR